MTPAPIRRQIETVVLPDAKVNETLNTLSFSWVVDVPYGNYMCD